MFNDIETLQSITAAYDKQELDRLHSLWKRARKDAKRKQEELEATKRQRELLELHAQRQHQEALKAREKDLEAQMEKNDRLATMIDTIVKQREQWLQTEAEADSRLKKETMGRDDELRRQHCQIAALTAEVQRLEASLSIEAAKNDRLAEEVGHRASQLEELQRTAAERASEVAQLRVRLHTAEEERMELQRALSLHYGKSEELSTTATQLRQRDAELAELRTRLVEAEAQRCSVCSTLQPRVKALEGELQACRHSNRRLIHLLSSTAEHAAEFRPLVADLPEDEGLVFCRTDRLQASLVADILEEKRRDGPDPNTADYAVLRKHESDYWIPSEVFRLVNQFLSTHFPTGRASLFYDLLVAINRVWKAKELRVVETALAPYKRRLQDFKRRLQLTVAPMVDEKAVRRDLERLKRSIDASKFRVIRGPQDTSGGGRPLQTAVEYLEALLTKLSFCQSEVAVLRERLHDCGHGASASDGVSDDQSPEAEGGPEPYRTLLEEVLAKLSALCTDYERCLDSATVPAHPDRYSLATFLELQKDFLESLRDEIGACQSELQTLAEPIVDRYFY
eukprot:GGOE01001859.1.p1 GENE.GGOE01001859.1~~GGOE01001859.1.p1  ORF type:complete len:567 (-),score=192.74 GGOE01001859.1:219-1919(-)